MSDYKFFVDGEVLYSSDLNGRFSSVLLGGQSVDSGVVVGDLVYNQVTSSMSVSGATDPIAVNGVYVADGTHNGEVSYTNGSYWLWYDTSDKFWKITVSKGSGTVLFKRFDGMYSDIGVVFGFNNTLLWHKTSNTSFSTFSAATSYVNGLTSGGFTWELPTVSDISHTEAPGLLYELNEILEYPVGQGGEVRNYADFLNENYDFVVENAQYYTSEYSDSPTNSRVYYFSLWNGTIFDINAGLDQCKAWAVSRRAEGFTELITGGYESDSGTGSVVVDSVLEWVTSSSATPQGMYVGNDVVMLSGLVVNLSGLTPGAFYWMDVDGKLTDDMSSAFSGVRVGRAVSDTMLLLDIDVTGDNSIVEMV